jgi:hypothetical protein
MEEELIDAGNRIIELLEEGASIYDDEVSLAIDKWKKIVNKGE